MNWATPIWIAIGVAILATEGVALLNSKTGDTLSEHVWNWITIRNKPKKFTAYRFFVLAFMLWLTGHFAFGWWAG
jgi:hypothetical protein